MQEITNATIQPLNIASAAFIIQIVLSSLMYAGFYILRSNTDTHSMHGESPRLSLDDKTQVYFFLFIISTFALVLFCEEMQNLWSPLFAEIPELPKAKSMLIAIFLIDSAFAAYLIYNTGGSKNSPFSAILFTIPALCIFLRLPPESYISTGLLCLLLYYVCFTANTEKSGSSFATALINTGCLIISIVTGHFTRPTPM
jgi:hypothetical protein